MQFGTGKVQARHRADLRSRRKRLFHLTEHATAETDERRQIGARDFDLDRPTGGETLFEEARLFRDGERAGEFSPDLLHSGINSPTREASCARNAHEDLPTAGDEKEVADHGIVEGLGRVALGIDVPVRLEIALDLFAMAISSSML